MSDIRGPAPKPCDSCPYRRDVPSGVWSANEYAKLLRYDGDTAYQPIELFQCHQHGPDDPRPRVCAGWTATHGAEDLLSVRVAVSMGRLEPEVFDYRTDVPVFESGTEAAMHGVAEIDDPPPEASAMIGKIVAKRSDVVFG